jgi:hypothetical protein
MLFFVIPLRKVVYNVVAKEERKKTSHDWRGDLLYLGKLIFWISGVCFFILLDIEV